MDEYTVIWMIEVSADSAHEAAELAQEIQCDPNSLATVFDVMETGGEDACMFLSTLEHSKDITHIYLSPKEID